MQLLRLRQLAFTSVALLAMFVSAVSACACTHLDTEPQEAAASCHTTSHSAEPVAQTEPTGDTVRGGCGCFVRVQVPGFLAKTETSKERHLPVSEEAEAFIPADRPGLVLASASAVFVRRPLAHSAHLARSGPSRAPPRL